jgi:hypothetical protein
MNRDTLVFCLFALIFFSTALVLKSLLPIEGVGAVGAMGLISGPLSFWWAFKFLANRSVWPHNECISCGDNWEMESNSDCRR